MRVQIGHFEWQLLRTALRAEAAGTPALGRELRVSMARRTKDGTFLDKLVAEGLLAVAEPPAPPDPAVRTEEPAQFRARYRLTEMGKFAAEYGEYDR